MISIKCSFNNSCYAIIAGLCASSGSFFGKLSSIMGDIDKDDGYLNLLPKLICIGLMLLCNAMVWRFFVKALHDKGGSLVATVSSAATNYCLSAFLGCLIFGEKLSAIWWFGTTLVLIGLILIGMERKYDVKEMKQN